MLGTVLGSKNTKKKKEGRREGGNIIVFYLGSIVAKNDIDMF